jgi:hypothetical protein
MRQPSAGSSLEGSALNAEVVTDDVETLLPPRLHYFSVHVTTLTRFLFTICDAARASREETSLRLNLRSTDTRASHGL